MIANTCFLEKKKKIDNIYSEEKKEYYQIYKCISIMAC